MRTMLFLMLLVFASHCSGVSGAYCSATAECVSGLVCAGPDEGPSCGIAPKQLCASSTDCPSGEVCHAVYDGCSTTGTGSECGVPCGACDTGFRCNASSTCEAIPCDEGFTCSAIEHCDTTAAHSTGAAWTRTQGCVRNTCTKDSDCVGSQACVNGLCESGPGSCKNVVAVP